MPNASTALLHALLERGDYLEQFTADELKAMLPILDAAHTEVLGKIALAQGKWTQEWLAEMAADLDAIYQAAAAKAYDEARPRLTQLAIDEGAWVEATTKQIAMGLSLSTPAPSLLSAVLDLPTNIGGSTLAQMFEGLGINSRTAAYTAIQQGMLEGDTVDAMTRRLRGEVVKRATWKTIDGKRQYVPGVYTGGAMTDVTTRQAESLARTATMHVGNQAREIFYKQNDDLIKGYQRVETLDTHTCLVAGTPVETPYGAYPIESMHKWELVIGGSGTPKRINGTMSKKVRGVVRINLSNGKSIVCTPDHRFLTCRGWVEAKELKADEALAERL